MNSQSQFKPKEMVVFMMILPPEMFAEAVIMMTETLLSELNDRYHRCNHFLDGFIVSITDNQRITHHKHYR